MFSTRLLLRTVVPLSRVVAFSSNASTLPADSANVVRYTKLANLTSCDALDQIVRVRAWISSVRKKGALWFLHISEGDSSDKLQVVVNRRNIAVVTAREGVQLPISDVITQGSVVDIEGRLSRSPGPEQPIELRATKLYAASEGLLPAEYRVDAHQLPLNHARQTPQRRVFDDRFTCMLALRASFAGAVRTSMEDVSMACLAVDPPTIVRNPCDGGSDVFELRKAGADDDALSFFSEMQKTSEDRVYLTTSSQLYLEAMLSPKTPRVYCLQRAYRADQSQSRFHMAEFDMLEVEMSFVDTIASLTKEVETCVQSVVTLFLHNTVEQRELLDRRLQVKASYSEKLEEEAKEPFSVREDRLRNIFSTPFHRVTFDEALSSLGLSDAGISSFNKQQELRLVEKLGGNRPLFVTHFPADDRPFYMARSGGRALCCDLLLPAVGELVGGSVREPCRDALASRLNTNESDHYADGLAWYLDTRHSSMPPHAGFGLGVDRLLQYLLRLQNIKDTRPFPRAKRMLVC